MRSNQIRYTIHKYNQVKHTYDRSKGKIQNAENCALHCSTSVGREINTTDGQDNVHHIMQPPSILGAQVTEPGHNATSQYAFHHTSVQVRLRLQPQTGSPQTCEEVEEIEKNHTAANL